MKKHHIRILFFSIAVLAVCFLSIDWYRYLHHMVIKIEPSDVSRILKRIASFLVFMFVLGTGVRSVSRKDHRMMAVIFAMIFTGDMLLLFNLNRTGMALFFITQIFLVVRNGSGILSFVSSGGKNLILAAGLSAAALMLDIAVIKFLFMPMLAGSPMLSYYIVYSTALTLSMYIALLAPFAGSFKRKNALLITAGMICFFICDLTVGVRIAAADEYLRTFATSLTWVFYLPALVCIALSGYDPE